MSIRQNGQIIAGVNPLYDTTGQNTDGSMTQKACTDNFLNTKQITNCLTEIPQKIKYTLENGVLTLKAGSIVTVPYGTTDLSGTYPIGVEFLHPNFKVYDRKFADGLFFVWAEVQEDISSTATGTSKSIRFISLDLENNSLLYNVTSSSISDDEQITVSCVNYNTLTNKTHHYASGGVKDYLTTFPLLTVKGDGTYYYGSIDQIFNGIGYIGSTIWVDKGVKGLIPDGRNADGSLKNIEWTNDKVRTATGVSTGNFFIGYSFNIDTFGEYKSANWYYDNIKNKYIYADGTEYSTISLGSVYLTSGVISNFQTKAAFHAIDYSDLDNKVSKTGDTMTGNLIISQDGQSQINLQNTATGADISSTTAPSSTQYMGYISSLDKNGDVGFYISNGISTNGNVYTNIRTQRIISGSTKNAGIQLAVDQNGKAIYSPAQLITTYVSGTSGYNIWSNGYCEQWGQKAVTTSNTTISFSKTFKDTNYNVQATSFTSGYCVLISQAAASCVLKVSSNNNVKWRACGYLDTNQY